MQPDVAELVVSIYLAAYKKPTEANNAFVFLSVPSMVCPHVTGIVTLIEYVHPGWSSAAIKSALVTTGDVHTFTCLLFPEKNDSRYQFHPCSKLAVMGDQ